MEGKSEKASWMSQMYKYLSPQPNILPVSEDNSHPLLRCTNLTKRYGDVTAIDDLTYETNATNLGLLGPNGSGKSTLVKMMLGLIYPTSGTIEMGYRPEQIRVIPDYPNLPANLTVDEWMARLELVYGHIKSNFDVEEIMQVEASWKIGNLSAGQYRKIAILPMFYGNPDLIILDEPTNFLDIIARARILKLMKDQIRFTNSNVIIASHRLEEIRLFATEVLVLKEGKNLFNASIVEDSVIEYQIRVNDTDTLLSMLDRKDIIHKEEETFLGTDITIQVSHAIWGILGEFTAEGGVIFAFNAVDKLGNILEEMFA